MDIRVKSFVAEAAGRLDFLCAEYGLSGPEVVPDEAGAYPLLRTVRYQRPGCAVEISLVLSYMGDPAQRTPATRCAVPWTGRLRPCGTNSTTNPARTLLSHGDPAGQ